MATKKNTDKVSAYLQQRRAALQQWATEPLTPERNASQVVWTLVGFALLLSAFVDLAIHF